MTSSPQGVKQAILAIWATLAISSFSALAANISGFTTQGEFIFCIFSYAVLCIIPYKLSKRSNPARYVYVILTAISFLFMFSGVGTTMNIIDFAVSVLLVPIDLFVIYKLFQPEASIWFTSK